MFLLPVIFYAVLVNSKYTTHIKNPSYVLKNYLSKIDGILTKIQQNRLNFCLFLHAGATMLDNYNQIGYSLGQEDVFIFKKTRGKKEKTMEQISEKVAEQTTEQVAEQTLEKKAIGFKVEWKSPIVLVILGAGVVLVVCGILYFALAVQGALDGAVAGGLIGAGLVFTAIGVSVILSPKELVYIDDKSVYMGKRAVGIGQILGVYCKGNTITLDVGERKISQSFLKNNADCARVILEAMQELENRDLICQL